MEINKVTDEYFKQFKNHLKYEKTNKVIGFEYSLGENNKEDKLLRFIIDENLNASMSKNKTNKVCPFKYIQGSDLLIIGYSLEGQQVIDFKGRHRIKKGEVFYFRPSNDFTVELFDSSFLYYFIDLKSLEKTSYCSNCNSLCLNNLCRKGEINIKNSPYLMEAYIDEMKEIMNLEIDSFLKYAKVKGKLFNYLTWFLKLKESSNLLSEDNRCSLYYVSGAKKIMIDNLDKQITVKEIAERLGISTYILQKSFKEVENTTVYNFMRNSKIDNSRILLKNMDLSIMDISQRVGYENPSKFSTTFKDIMGCTPTEYRENIVD